MVSTLQMSTDKKKQKNNLNDENLQNKCPFEAARFMLGLISSYNLTATEPEGFRNQPQTDRSSAQWEIDTNHCLRQFIQSSDLQSRTSSNPFPVTQNSNNKHVSRKGTNGVTWHDRTITRAQSAFICANKAHPSLWLCFWSSIHEAALTLVISQLNVFR